MVKISYYISVLMFSFFIATIFACSDDNGNENDDTSNGDNYESVDLGLSVNWASCNIGASVPEDYGDYFCWGETQPKSKYQWDNYKWCRGNSSTITKYCTNSKYGNVDNKNILSLEDDAAHANWGGAWRMPTKEEIEELLNNTTIEIVTSNGVRGCRYISKKNGKSIFLPSAGACNYKGLLYSSEGGWYWSSSLCEDMPNDAYDLLHGKTSTSTGKGNRSLGQSVRPVRAH